MSSDPFIMPAFGWKLVEVPGETGVCSNCGRHTRDNAGFIAPCGNRLSRAEECGWAGPRCTTDGHGETVLPTYEAAKPAPTAVGQEVVGYVHPNELDYLRHCIATGEYGKAEISSKPLQRREPVYALLNGGSNG